MKRRRRANGAPEETYDSNVVEVRSPKQMLQLIKLAQADDQLLVVDYYTTWCGPCKKVRFGTSSETLRSCWFG